VSQEPTKPAEVSPAQAKSSTGLDANIAGLLCYVAGWISGIVFLVLEKQNEFVRYHAIQAIAAFGVLTIAQIVLGIIPVVGWILSWLVWVATIILWIVMMVKAYQGQRTKLPWAGNLAEKNSKFPAKQ